MTSKFHLLALATCLLFLWRPSPASSQTTGAVAAGDTLEVHFRVGQSNLDLSYLDNQQQIDNFVARVRQQYASKPDKSLKLDVFSGASPEGPEELNRRLGEQRGIALRDILVERFGNLLDQVTVINQGPRWGALYKMVEESNEPWRNEVLAILAAVPEKDEWKVDPREQKLRKLHNGTVWTQLVNSYLTELRSSGSAVVAPVIDEKGEWVPRKDTLIIKDTIVYLPESCPCPEKPIDHSYVWAVKTNLLLLAATAPNLQVEFPLGMSNRWSIESEIFWPWWIWNNNANALQCGNLGLEVKYWLGNREKHHLLDGWHVGLGTGVGYYDFELEPHHGYQGEYVNVYANIGYQHRFGRRQQWGIDAGLGIGYIPTQYREYLGSSVFPVDHTEEMDYHLMWQRSDVKHIFGLTHINVTIAYFFHCRKQNNK